jgi:hypothetical protein
MESLAELLFNDSVTIFAFVRGLCSMDDGMMKSHHSNLQGFTTARSIVCRDVYVVLTLTLNEAITPSSTRQLKYKYGRHGVVG